MKSTSYIVVGIIAAVLVVMCIVKYNGLVTNDESVAKSWPSLVSVLQQRYAAVPKLINSIILYNGHEDSYTKELAAAYKKFQEAGDMQEKVKAADKLEAALSSQFIQAGQRYAGISSNFQFTQLKKDFESTGPEVVKYAQAYNDTVDVYNTYVRKFPNNFFALILNFYGERPYFKRQG